jgi:hypothetical protein
MGQLDEYFFDDAHTCERCGRPIKEGEEYATALMGQLDRNNKLTHRRAFVHVVCPDAPIQAVYFFEI